MGAAIHGDDLRTAAPSIDSTTSQAKIIKEYTVDSCPKLKASKPEYPLNCKSSSLCKSTTPVCIHPCSAKCLGVWWQHNLSATITIRIRKHKARKAFFATCSLGAFQGNLNPLFSSSIVETCYPYPTIWL